MDLRNQTVVVNFTKRVEDNVRDAILLHTLNPKPETQKPCNPKTPNS